MAWYWLLTTYGALGLQVFVEKTPTGEVIVPVFGSADGATGYLSVSAGPWEPRKTSRGELVSLLMGACKDARWVVLDPPPGAAVGEGIVGFAFRPGRCSWSRSLEGADPGSRRPASDGRNWQRPPESSIL
jgi:hypothetical protein